MKRGGDIWRWERVLSCYFFHRIQTPENFSFISLFLLLSLSDDRRPRPTVPPSLISVSSRRRTGRNYHSIRLSRSFIKPLLVWRSLGSEFCSVSSKKQKERNMILVVFIGSGMRWSVEGGESARKLPEMDKFNWNRLLLLWDHSGFDGNLC